MKDDDKVYPKQIVRNSIITPDGTELISRHRHDYKTHKDANGFTYMVDGGLSYERRFITDIPATETSVYLSDGHEAVRNAFEWGTYGIDGGREISYVKLKAMSNSHINNILGGGFRLEGWLQDLFKRELEYRNEIQE